MPTPLPNPNTLTPHPGGSFTTQKWLALGLLTVGVALVQIPSGAELQKDEEDLRQGRADVMIGLMAVLMACCTSAFSGVYFERILKKKAGSLWLRNIQLGIFGVLLGFGACYTNDGDAIREGGFFQHYVTLKPQPRPQDPDAKRHNHRRRMCGSW